jgi:2-polyprenyl-3-methyl-5-hydroxy-6-metoxy-1,4-benzoquinol methylase
VTGRYRKDWSELAKREPYFAVLTDRRYLSAQLDDEGRRQFFESGEADVERLLSLAREHAGGDFNPGTALDFGCGVGRLTLALAQRFDSVTGCDVAPEMVELAGKNAAQAGVTNASFVTSLDALEGRRFDFICSLIVFQHIPVSEGLEILTRLLTLLAPGGIAALHFTTRRPGTLLQRLGRRARAAFPIVHRLAQRLEKSGSDLPYMQMNAYDPAQVARRMQETMRAEPRIVPHDNGPMESALFIVRRYT